MGEWINKNDLDSEISDWWKINLEFETYADKAIDHAEKFVKVRLIHFKVYPYSPEMVTDAAKLQWVDDIKSTILIPLAIYYLFAHENQEDKVKDKREDAIASLTALLEGGISGEEGKGGGESMEEKVAPQIAVVQGHKTYHGFTENPYVWLTIPDPDDKDPWGNW